MEENNEKKIVVKLERHPLGQERRELEIKAKYQKKIILFSIFFLALGLVFGYSIFNFTNRQTVTSPSKSSKMDDIINLFDNLWLYKNDYEDLDEELENRAYYGMTSFIDDPYTSYMSSDELNSFSSSINMNYVGIGVQYNNYEGISTVVRVFKDSPAELAGVMVGDIIKAVDGFAVSDYSSDEIRELVLGEEGTVVTLTISRAGQEMDIPIYRGEVDSTAYAYTKDDVVVLELLSFGMNTANEVARYLEDYRDYHKLIIDLRDNTGGYQDSVQEVAGLFLGKDELVMRQIYNTGEESYFYTLGNTYFGNFENIILLTDDTTASAAEVLTMCLKELHKNTFTVGTTTYGKGVVQTTYGLRDGSALKITTSKWLSPNGEWINGVGIKPDYEVFLDDVCYEFFYAMRDDETFALDSVSEFVRLAEECLRFLDYDLERVDGYFDASFERALILFENEHGFVSDGILDKESYEAMVSAAVYEWTTNVDKDYQFLKALELLK